MVSGVFRMEDKGYLLDGNQYRIIVECAPNMIWRAGTDTLCNYFNATWLAYTGRSLPQEMGNGWAEGVHEEDLDRCIKTYLGCFEKRQAFEMLYRLRRHDGEFRWIHDKGTPYYQEDGTFGGYIGSCLDIHEQIVGETWKALAQRDGLTGIMNRHFFEQEARLLFETSRRSGCRLSAVMLDLDDFKYINDHYGHPFGDKILIAFASILKDSIRGRDLLGRYGGDEFMILLPRATAAETSAIMCRIVERVKQSFCYDENGRILLAFSHGIAELCEEDTFESFLQRADSAMYIDKRRKKKKKETTVL